jgi:hypothetical protein
MPRLQAHLLTVVLMIGPPQGATLFPPARQLGKPMNL